MNLKLQQLLDLESQSIIHYAARAQIERTKTNKELEKLENEYIIKIKKYFAKIVVEYKNKEYLLHEARQKYGDLIYVLIKSMVTRVYFLGMEYVARATKRPYLITLEKVDEQKILEGTKNANDMFWRLITKYLQVIKNRSLVQPRKQQLKEISQIKIVTAATQKKPEEDNLLLSIFTNASLIITAIATKILALATTEKTKQLDMSIPLLFEEIDEEGIDLENIIQKNNMLIVFATAKDDRVCPICSALEDEEWEPDDPSIPVIPDDLHPNCRCRLLLKINDETKSM